MGPMNVRLENLHADTSTANYVSFLSQSQRTRGRESDTGSIHSVSSVRSVMSGMSSLWSNFGISAAGAAAKTEKQKAALQADLIYLYSSFTKIPCLRLAPDRRSRLIEGYEEFPFDTAVPLLAFKNISALEISDIDIRQFFGWDRLAEQLRTLTVKRAGVEDPADLLINIVLDDMDKRRRRSSKAQTSPTSTWAASSSSRPSPTMPHADIVGSSSAPSPSREDGRGEENAVSMVRTKSEETSGSVAARHRSRSPVRPTSSRTGSAHGHIRAAHKVKRSDSGSSHSSMSDGWNNSRGSAPNPLFTGSLPASKWRFLKHLSLADNSLTSISTASLVPLANTLHSLDLSLNLFSQIPDSLASLTSLRALNLSNCMIDALHSLTKNPLPAITALNLRSNRLRSLAGVERLYPLERLDLRDNRLTDPTELARLTGIPDLREIWVAGNPFTKTHSNYRVTIFNLFRKSPGYTEDILIDSYGPGYSERRQLVERVAEKPNVPVVKPPVQEYNNIAAVDVKKGLGVVMAVPPDIPNEAGQERPAPLHSSPSETHSGSTRRKKAPKRRIVDLSTAETPTTISKPSVDYSSEEVTAAAAGSDIGYEFSPGTPAIRMVPESPPLGPRATISQTDVPRIDTSRVPPLPPVARVYSPSALSTPSKESQDWNVSGEIYRKKIEALRNEVGNGWLSVLSEEGWEMPKNTQLQMGGAVEYSPAETIRPSPTPRPTSQQAIHSGRTLG